MITVFARHHVKDFAAWKEAFDSAATVRAEKGELGYDLYQDVDDPNEVTLRLHYRDEETARRFFGAGEDGPSMDSKKLLDLMLQSGVDEAPKIYFMNRMAGGDL